MQAQHPEAEAVFRIINQEMAFQAKVGVRVQAVHGDGVDLMLPFDQANLSGPQVLSAGATFLLAESAGAALMWLLFPPSRWRLLARNVEIRYLKPACFDLFARPRLGDIQYETSYDALTSSGQGRAEVPLAILAPDGTPVARARAQYSLRVRSESGEKT